MTFFGSASTRGEYMSNFPRGFVGLSAYPTRVVLGLVAGLLLIQAALAHHSVRANFVMDETVEVRGIVSEVNIRNPHSQYVLDVEQEGGSVQWLVEWSDRNALIRRKVDVDRIKVGDAIHVVMWPSRLLEHVGYFVQATLPDGSTFKDCGFAEFRRAVVDSKAFSCPEASGDQ